jgi:hypothetical protein
VAWSTILDERDIHGAPDATLGGYLQEHDRPPAFLGADDHPYTVSIEVEQTGDLRTPYQGFLVFPRWAETGLGIVGHVETPMLAAGRNRDDVTEQLAGLSLERVKDHLDAAISRARRDPDDPSVGPHD